MRSAPLLRFSALIVSQFAVVHASSAQSDTTRAQRWRSEITAVATQLEQKHPGIYAHTSREAFQKLVVDLTASADKRDDAAMTVGLMELIASIGDGHTQVTGNLAALGFHRLPVAFYPFDDGVYIVDADTSLARFIGARVLAFDGVPTDSVSKLVARVIPRDNEQGLRLRLPGNLVNPEVLHEVGATRSRERVTVDISTAAGTERVVLTPVAGSSAVTWAGAARAPESLPISRRNANRNYWMQWLPGDRTLYIAYNRCANDPANPMAQFIATAKQIAADSGAARIIVDFRNNGGGNSGVFYPLQGWLLLLHQSQPEVQIVGVVGRATFSSGLMNAISFQRQLKVRLYGEPTGNKPNHFGEVKTIPLTSVGLVVNHSSRKWTLVPDDPPTLMPDVLVPVLASDYFGGNDAVLRAILGH